MKRLLGSLVAPIALICWLGKAILEGPLETVILIGIYMLIHIIFPAFIINYVLRTTKLEDSAFIRYFARVVFSVVLTVVVYAGMAESVGL